MAVYARSDVASVAIPVSDGGCGDIHFRPVVQGAPAKVWKLTCGPCETYLKRDITASTIEWTDKEHVKHIYNTSTWGDDPTRIPLTPDEERVSNSMEKQGKAAMASVFEGMAKGFITEQQRATAADTEASIYAQAQTQAAKEIEDLKAQIAALQEAFGTSQPLRREKKGTIVPESPNLPTGLKGICPECGGPLRKPGQRGATPKVCTSCRAKAKVLA